MKNNYKAVVIQVFHNSNSALRDIKKMIKDLDPAPSHIMEIEPNTWFVGGSHVNPGHEAQIQLESRYPGSKVAVLGARSNDLTTECKYIIDPDADKNDRFMIYLCSSSLDDDFFPVFNTDVYYINLFYEINPFTMENTYGMKAREMINKSREISKYFETGDDDQDNCSNYVLSPLLQDIGNDPYFVRQIMFDIYNGYNRSSDIIRSLLFQKYD